MIGGIYIMANLKLTEEQKVAIWKARIERGKDYAKKISGKEQKKI